MREGDGFEIDRAYDLLPHVVGASWATIWFRLQGRKSPTKDEFREKVVEYFHIIDPLVAVDPQNEIFSEMNTHIKNRHDEEIRRILSGNNPEIEKRFKRYLDYG